MEQHSHLFRFKPVTDTNTPQHVIVLKAPTDAPAALTNVFDDQIAFGCELENIERSIDGKAGTVGFEILGYTIEI
jgi:hypothetical protein